MPINKKHKILFVHIPKTGGTSIESFFSMITKDSLWFDRWDMDMESFLEQYKDLLLDEPKRSYEPQHYPPEFLKKIIPGYNTYFKFTFVRHPYTRMLSEYYWQQSKSIVYKHEFDPNQFHQWVVKFLEVIDSPHKEPQSFYLNEDYNFIGRFENLEADLMDLIKMIGKQSPTLEFSGENLASIHNTGLNKELLVPYISNATKEYLRYFFEDDFRNLGYKP